MDKRFLLALVLTAIVVIATPWLFGRQSTLSKAPTPSSAVPVPDSTSRPSADSSSTASTVPPVPSVEATPARDSSRLTASRSDSAPAQTVAPESTIGVTPVADYHFTNIGALPVSVELKSYRALDGSTQNVRLASSGNRLLSYRLFLPGDTIDLSRVPFQLERSRTGTSTELLTYRASVSGADVAIRYAFAPDSYLVRVSGDVKHPSATNGFIAVEMPNSLQSAEADSLDDQQQIGRAHV